MARFSPFGLISVCRFLTHVVGASNSIKSIEVRQFVCRSTLSLLAYITVRVGLYHDKLFTYSRRKVSEGYLKSLF